MINKRTAKSTAKLQIHSHLCKYDVLSKKKRHPHPPQNTLKPPKSALFLRKKGRKEYKIIQT